MTTTQARNEASGVLAARVEALGEFEASFWEKAALGGPDSCWEWQSSKSITGYGRFKVGNMWMVATHVSLYLADKPRPGNQFALHSCDNPPCVNPLHLRWGTNRDNVQDKVKRGRVAGERNPRARLTALDVSNIRSQYRRGDKQFGAAPLARSYGMAETTIRDIVKGRKWK